MIEFPAIRWMIAASLLAMAMWTIVALRRASMPRGAKVLGAMGTILIVLAAGEPRDRPMDRPRITVLVDCSPSTRTARFRDRDAVQRRCRALIAANAITRFVYFSDRVQADPPIGDMDCDRTTFPEIAPGDADAVLLFSDGQFALPNTSPPIYPVIDEAMETPHDGAVTDLAMRGRDDVRATIRNRGDRRDVRFDGTMNRAREQIGAGSILIDAKRAADATKVVAILDGASTDRWPENDQLSISAFADQAIERWWIGDDAPDGFRQFQTLPVDPLAFVLPSVIVMSEPPGAQAEARLKQYVRDLGGAVLFLEGAVASELSPLSIFPPQAQRRWIVLIDSSGSMATIADASRSRLQVATGAVRTLIDSLPPDDLLSVGSFARDLHWWMVDRPVRESGVGLLNADVPGGPTNLQAALEQIARREPSTLPIELIVITDADAVVDGPAAIAQSLKHANVRANAMILSAGAPSAALGDIVSATNGSMVIAGNSGDWSRDLRTLADRISPLTIVRDPTRVTFDASLDVPSRDLARWRRTWMKAGAMGLATTSFGGANLTLAVEQRIGLGRTFSIAFDPSDAERRAIVSRIEQRPRDPRFRVDWERGSTLRVTIEAFDPASKQYVNGLALSLRFTSGAAAASSIAIPQTAPGRYAISVDAPREPVVAAVELEDAIISRAALTGRYAPEFDAIGNDRAALSQLAERTGGRVIEANDARPIEFVLRRSSASDRLCIALTIAGSIAIGASIVIWRRAA